MLQLIGLIIVWENSKLLPYKSGFAKGGKIAGKTLPSQINDFYKVILKFCHKDLSLPPEYYVGDKYLPQ